MVIDDSDDLERARPVRDFEGLLARHRLECQRLGIAGQRILHDGVPAGDHVLVERPISPMRHDGQSLGHRGPPGADGAVES